MKFPFIEYIMLVDLVQFWSVKTGNKQYYKTYFICSNIDVDTLGKIRIDSALLVWVNLTEHRLSSVTEVGNWLPIKENILLFNFVYRWKIWDVKLNDF
jgi:hypothetical protein